MLILVFVLVTQILSQHVSKFAFGSCYKFYRTQSSTVFGQIATQNPEFFLWLGTKFPSNWGDAAYLDVMYYVG